MANESDMTAVGRKRKCGRRTHCSSISDRGCRDSGVTVSRIRQWRIRLLCTHKNHELVEFALADMSNKLFVWRYQVQLPEKREIAEFMLRALSDLEHSDD